MSTKPLGIAGRIANVFLLSEITPLLALVGLLLGLFALAITPREEEPQINVTFANVIIAFPGASAKEVESLVTVPAEKIVSEIAGVQHVYSMSSPGMVVLTVRFEVGEPRTDAIVRLYNAFYSNKNALPYNLGVSQPLIQPKGIDDVPIVTATLWSHNPEIGSAELLNIAHGMEAELQRVPGTREIKTIGGAPAVALVHFEPARLASYQLSLTDIRNALFAANTSAAAGNLVSQNTDIQLQVGTFLTSIEDIGQLVVGVFNNAPIFLRDVASVSLGADTPSSYVAFGVGAASNIDAAGNYSAVTITVAKKPGENAVEVANGVLTRFEQMQGIYLPDSVEVTFTRNYGVTAEEKAQALIKKLIFATLSVIVLIFFVLGRREAVVVGVAVIVTLAITLFASWAWGFTLNRVSLFALIFSIGILVDDAIVVVENIHRHMTLGGMSLKQSIPLAVDEVGGPTILATFTVIAALLPMAFVTGLMGPYMRPIPINASIGMLISLAVAFILTPWLFLKLFNKDAITAHAPEQQASRLHNFFAQLLTPFLNARSGRGKRVMLLAGIVLLIAVSMALVASQHVVMKMLPFDNKSEFELVVDMPEGTSLEQTYATLQALANDLQALPELDNYQLYAGTAAPISFNGLVRQYYLRNQPFMGEIQVNLSHKDKRTRKSHAIALEARQLIAQTAQQYNANVKIVELPPGPPVLAPLVAEIYGLDYQRQLEVAANVKAVFMATENVVDVDDTVEASQQKWILVVDLAKAAKLGVNQATIVADINAAVAGEDASFLHDDYTAVAIPIRLTLPSGAKSDLLTIQNLRVRSTSGELIALSELTQLVKQQREQTIHRKNLLPVVYVTGDAAGDTDSPLYGLAAMSAMLERTPVSAEGEIIEQYFTTQPANPYQWSIKWDGEWQVTYETFRDMGIAYSVGLIMIYLLVVAQFKSYLIPLIIMAPIPLTIIGIMPGHALLGQQFTAPSMIGMIALAGIIVRNSILLVDFIQQQVAAGKDLQQATIEAAAVRSVPIALTAVAAMMGGFFILDDPIFGGLAVSLIFGLLISTVLTLLVIPVVYYAYHYKTEAS
ncbi:efflux RND transporter permease subunit [Rheinheimera metallidurans]|uniref:efflux RND transporter permease subunit n=1 Tax=Rheinheimera metallidurans TaxID=2925781 RepID=UPI00300111D5